MQWVLRVLVALLGALLLTGLLYDPEPGPLRLARQTRVINGTPLTFHQRGDGRDVVMIHGGMGSAEDFEPLLDGLADGYRLTLVDRPGFGGSRARDGDPTYPGNARLIAGLIRELGLVRPIVVGHSHGGGVALQLAEAEPASVGALVLLAPAAFPLRPAKAFDHLLATPVIGEGLAAWIGGAFGPRMMAAVLEPMTAPDRAALPADFVSYRQTLWTNPRSIAVYSRQALTDEDGLKTIAEKLGTIHVPTAIVGCDQDPTEGTMVDSRRLTKEIPGSTLKWLSGCGHYIEYRHPEVVLEAIRAMGVPAAG